MKRACIIGWPVEHSRSPLIHGYWLKQHNIDGEYAKEAVNPDDLETFLKALGDNGYAGANVTIPHKEAAFRIADETDEAARAIGAANTLWLEDGKLFASNTDSYGFMTHLNSQAPLWVKDDRPVVILGAGGAARAIIHGLLQSGVEQILLCNRTQSRAQALADLFGPKIKVIDWAERSQCLEGAGLLVNTTQLGMEGSDPLDIELRKLPFTAIVADIVYVPLETDLLLSAQVLGLKTVEGLGMLLHQAVPGFEKWFGVRPAVTEELRNLITDDLDG